MNTEFHLFKILLNIACVPNTIHEDIKINNAWLLSLGSSTSNEGKLTKNPVIFMHCVSALTVECSQGRSRNPGRAADKAFGYEP